MIRRPPRSTHCISSAASDVYKRQYLDRLQALSAITVPTMVIAFELDMLTAAPLCQEVAKAIPGCRYVEIPGAGHAGPFEQPDVVNSPLLEFFAEV